MQFVNSNDTAGQFFFATFSRRLVIQKKVVGRNLEPQTTIKTWMFGETTISYVKIGNHPSETTIL